MVKSPTNQQNNRVRRLYLIIGSRFLIEFNCGLTVDIVFLWTILRFQF